MPHFYQHYCADHACVYEGWVVLLPANLLVQGRQLLKGRAGQVSSVASPGALNGMLVFYYFNQDGRMRGTDFG